MGSLLDRMLSEDGDKNKQPSMLDSLLGSTPAPKTFNVNDPSNLEQVARDGTPDNLATQGALSLTQGLATIPSQVAHTVGRVFKPAEDVANKIDQFIAGIQPAQTGQNPNAEAAIQTLGYVGGQLYGQGKLFGALAKGVSAVPTALERVAPSFAARALGSISKAGRYVEGVAEQLTTPGRAAFLGNVVKELPKNIVAGVGSQALLDPESVATPKGLAMATAFAVGGAALDAKGKGSVQRPGKNINPNLSADEQAVMSEISLDRDVSVPDVIGAANDARFKMLDRFNPARLWQRDVPESKLHDAAVLYNNGTNGRVEAMLNSGTFTLAADGNPIQSSRPGFNQIIKQGLKNDTDIDQLRAYLVANHALDAGVQDKGITFKNFNNDIAGRVVANVRPEIKAVADQVYQYLDDVRSYGKAGGVVNEKSALNLAFKYPNYIPLFRDMAQSIDPAMFPEGASFGPGSVIKTLGNTTELDVRDPLKNIEDLTSIVVRAADRNMFGNTLYSDVIGNRTLAKELGVELLQGQDKFTNPEYYKKIQQVKEKLVQSGVADAHQEQFSNLGVKGLASGQVTDHYVESLATDLVHTFSKTFDRDNNILNVFGQDGIKRMQLSPELGKMYEAMSPKTYGAVVAFASKAANALKVGTTANPAFAVINSTRDTFDASIQSKYGFRFGVDSWRGFQESMSRGEYAGAMRKEWLQAGGGHGSINQIGSDSYKNVFHSPLPGSNIVKAFAHPLQLLKEMSRPFEEAARLGEYMRGREQGATAVEAALNSRNATTDFAQIGASMNAWSQMTAFLNPAIQSIDRNMQTLFSSAPVKTPFIPDALNSKLPASMQNVREGNAALMKGFAAISIPSIMLWVANRNDQDIQDLRKTPQGATSWFTRLPGGEIAKIPKPFLYGQMFGTTFEAILDKYATDGDEESIGRLADAVQDQVVFNAIPTLASIPMQWWANKSTFTGGQIISDSQQGLDPQAQATNNTSKTAEYVSSFLNSASGGKINVSPIHLDFLIQSLGGSTAKDLTNLKGNGVDRGMGDLPFFRRFFASDNTMNVEPIQKFYQQADKLNVVLNTVNKYVKEGDQDGLNSYLSSHMDEFSHAQIYAETRKQLSTLRSTIDQIHKSDGFDSNQKREYIKYLNKQAIEIARVINEASR